MPNRSSGDRTKLILADSLRRLMAKKPVDKIKIREIVEECGLNRQTFYYHFQDMYALVEWMYRYDGEIIINETFGNGDIVATAKGFLNYAEEHREELICVIDSKAQLYFSNFMNKGIGICFDMIIDKHTDGKNIPKEYKSFLSRFYTSAVLGVSLDWIKRTDAARPTSDELLNMFRTTTLSSLKLAIDSYKVEEE